MTHLASMLRAHPRARSMEIDTLQECIDACYDCEQACNSCADACLGEPRVAELVRCIRLNLDCAEICDSTGDILSRLTEPDPRIMRVQLEACLVACRLCAEECERHAAVLEHCRLCAEQCRRCEQACEVVLRSMALVVS